MQRALVWMFRHTDIRVVYSLMHFWLVWYVIVRPTNTRGAYRFHRMRGRSRLLAALDVYISFYHFGKAILDRFAVYAGHKFDIVVENRELYFGKLNRPDGFVLLFSHIGNSEMAAYTLPTLDKRMNILAFGGESPVVMNHRAKILAENNIGLITIYPHDMGHIFAIHEALERGEVLAVAGDRRMGEKTIDCRVIGERAPLPAGPFQLCVTMHCPAVLTFVLKEPGNRYHIYTEELQIDASLPRGEQARDLAQKYANRIGQMALAHPYEWFNFFDFWA